MMSYFESDIRFELSIFENLLLQIKIKLKKIFLGTSKLHNYRKLFIFLSIFQNYNIYLSIVANKILF
jgi:hypothetical protein